MANGKRIPLLDLDTLAARATVTIDGSEYELRNAGELSLLEFHRFARKAEEVDGILAKDDDGEELALRLTELLDELCRLILEAPDEVHRRLKDVLRLRIVQAFNELPGKTTPAPAEDASAPAPDDTVPLEIQGLLSTGESTSRD